MIQPLPTALYPIILLISQQPTPTPHSQAIPHVPQEHGSSSHIIDFVCNWIPTVSLFSRNSSSLKPSSHAASFRKLFLTSVVSADLSPVASPHLSDGSFIIISFISSFKALAGLTHSV